MNNSKKSSESLSPRQLETLRFIEDSYRDIAKGLGVSAVGTIQDHVRALTDRGYLEKSEKSFKLKESAFQIPVVGHVAAGALQEALEVPLGYIPAPQNALKKRSFTPGRIFALKVRGESMIEAGILPGDYVVVDRDQAVRTGDFVVAETGGEATVKEIRFPKSVHDPIELRPHNSTMKPIMVPQNEELSISGKVIAIHRFLER